VVSEWREVTVDQIRASSDYSLATGPFGSSIGSKYFQKSGVPVIRGSNLSEQVGTRLLEDDLVFLSLEKAAQFRRSIVRPGDLVFTCWGTVGQVGIIDERSRFKEYVISNKQMKLTPDPCQADSLFLYYCFSGPELSSLIKQQAIGSSVPGFNLGQLKAIRLSIPPLDEQHAIARLLGSLDDKIYLNGQTNRTLHEMGRTLFGSWFVEFDPVVARAAGRTPFGITARVAPLFPTEFVESDKGPVPQGWHSVPFSALVNILSGGTPKTSVPDYWSGDIPWFSVVDTPGPGDVFVVDTQRKITQRGLNESAAELLEEGTTIITARGTVGNVAVVGTPMAINQSCYGLTGKSGLGPYFVYYATLEALEDLLQRTHGSVFSTITKMTFDSVALVEPPTEIAQAFEEEVGRLLQRIKASLEESRTLAELRDFLLPRLLSGEIQSHRAEKLLEQAI